MTNGELFKKENPDIEVKINGSCVWIYFDGVNHYTIPTEWWNTEIGVFGDIKAEIETLKLDTMYRYVGDFRYGVDTVVAIIDKHMKEGE